MENIALKLKRVGCAQVSDNWLEGDGQDEVHYLVSIPGGVDPFNRLKKGNEFKIHEGQTIEMDEHVWTIDWRSPDYRVSFWDTDSLSPDDVLGSFKLKHDQADKLVIIPENDTEWDGEKFHFKGAGAKYWVWFSMLKPTGAAPEIRVVTPSRGASPPRLPGVRFPI